MKNLILIGGGGHCRACIDVIEAEGKFKVAGIVDVKEKVGEKVFGYKIIGSDDDLKVLVKKYKYFLITIGQVKNFDKRLVVYTRLKKCGVNFPIIISSVARVSKYAQIGAGTIVMHQAVVNAGARLGENCIINTGAIVEHDAWIGDHSHISTGSVVNGCSKVGNKVFLGSKSVIRENLSIVDETIVGAGSVVIREITQKGTYVGQPAEKVE